MSDYTRTENFTAKDALATGNPDKVILGADVDGELNAALVAINSKLNATDIASQAEAQAGTSNTKVMTPLRTEDWANTWAAENAGMVADIQLLADPGADRILFWDDSADAAGLLTIGSGLTVTGGTTLEASATGFVPTSRTLTAGTGLTGGGDLSANRSFALSHLGLEALTDPGTDRIYIWDESVNLSKLSTVSDGIQVTATPSVTLDVNGLSALTQAQVVTTTDYVPVFDASATLHKKVLVSDLVGSVTGVPTTKRVTTTEARTNDTLATSAYFTGWTLVAGTTYKIEGSLWLTTTQNSLGTGFRMRWDATTALLSGIIGSVNSSFIDTGGTSNGVSTTAAVPGSATGTTTSTCFMLGNSANDVATISGTITAGGSNSVLSMAWSVESGGSYTINMREGSWITLTAIS